jgi:hypothetical protein
MEQITDHVLKPPVISRSCKATYCKRPNLYRIVFALDESKNGSKYFMLGTMLNERSVRRTLNSPEARYRGTNSSAWITNSG